MTSVRLFEMFISRSRFIIDYKVSILDRTDEIRSTEGFSSFILELVEAPDFQNKK